MSFRKIQPAFRTPGRRRSTVQAPFPLSRMITLNSPTERPVAILLSAVWALAAVLAVAAFAAASMAVEPRAQKPAKAEAHDIAKSRASSPMLRDSGYALAKDKLG